VDERDSALLRRIEELAGADEDTETDDVSAIVGALQALQAELGVVCYAAPGKRGTLKIVA